MSNKDYFNLERDSKIIKAGGFFCNACLTGKPTSGRSPDLHYCQGCYDVLLKEVNMLIASDKRHRPSWIPTKPSSKASQGEKVSADIQRVGSAIMSTLNEGKSDPSTVRKVTYNKRGPKLTELPDDLIRELAGQGLGSKAITTKLAKQGYSVSYKTVQRRL